MDTLTKKNKKRKMHKLTRREQSALAVLVNNGKTVSQIASKLGIGKSTIAKYRSAGCKMMKPDQWDKIQPFIIDQLGSGMSTVSKMLTEKDDQKAEPVLAGYNITKTDLIDILEMYDYYKGGPLPITKKSFAELYLANLQKSPSDNIL
jgi:predicted transcriptional regulator